MCFSVEMTNPDRLIEQPNFKHIDTFFSQILSIKESKLSKKPIIKRIKNDNKNLLY